MFLIKNPDKRKDKISQLYDIVEGISKSGNIKELLELTLSKTLRALSSERGSIFLVGDNGKELFLKWSYNMLPNISVLKKKVGEGVLGRVAKDREAILVKNTRSDTRFKFSNRYHGYKTNSFLCAPIATDTKLIGVINITENKSKRPYTENDLVFLKILSDRIAFTIENNRLSSEITSYKKRTEINDKFVDLGKFASSISHELNSPLDGVMRFVNLALDSLKKQETREYLLEANKGLVRITNTTKALMDLAKSKNSSQGSININTAIENSINSLKFRTRYKSVDIKKYFSPDLPEIPDFGLESVFINLFKNALDSLDEEGVINIYTSIDNGFIKVSISDTGCGISKNNMKRIFEPFFTTKKNINSSGLGLSITYDIIKRYNGRIYVASQPRKGTKFTIYIPYARKK